MSASQDAAGGTGGGRGRLAEVIATRGGLAAAEAPFVIEHREALIYMLCEAAELEHGIMCQYLFAAFSLKQSADEGLSSVEVEAVQRWRKQVSHVATQEMLHLALVHNLLSAIGAAPHFARPNLPAPASHYPAGVELALLPFGERALQHFMFLERPEGWDVADAGGMAVAGRAAPVLSERDIVPRGQDFKTVGHLYRSIEAGLDNLVARHGEKWLFVGPPRAQATHDSFRWPELIAVTDLASARRAINEILEQGEGATTGSWQNAHFGQFVEILDEYDQFREANPDFDPVRPVIAANVRQPERDVSVPLITDRLTARVTDLFNVAYEILLQIFERYFAHTEETDAQLQVLAEATVAIMLRVIKPLGDLITTLPVGDDQPGRNAGPSFELFYESDYLMPHREAAWALLTERLNEAAWLCNELCVGRGAQIADRLDPVLEALRDVARTLAAHLPDGSPQKLAAEAKDLDRDELAGLLDRAREFAATADSMRGAAGTAGQLAGLLSVACEAALTAGGGAAAEAAVIVPRLVNSVLRPLSQAVNPDTRVAAQASDGQRGEPVAGQTAGDRLQELAETATRLRVSMAGACPPELAEATAALQDLACAIAAPGSADAVLDRFWELQAGLPAGLQVAVDGPYLVTNVPALIDPLGIETRPAPQLALCRCGESAIKPHCDGSCVTAGFSGAKDPKRVPDQLDTYLGQQVTIFDNRGICQHSGLCTDRLATVFRTNAEPFVAPSGGRMDEIIRAVRDCPSGALSYAIGGSEQREQVDWGNARQPGIEVTRDGPYRITGGIRLAGPDGTAADRAEGASREHYALCRCGRSQNKPYCSGMHWYVNFRDPVPAEGSEPTPYQWAGGLTALTRMSRLFYEKHGPADPLLAPLLADIGPGQARRLAGWLAEALGGPAGDGVDARQVTIGAAPAEFAEPQRTRWVALLCTAADEAALPADPEFRSVLSSCLEWASRTALGLAQAGAEPQKGQAPRWDWGPGGPPAPAAQAAEEAGDAVPLPGPDEQVSFAAHIKPLFRQSDRQSMSFAFDLWSFEDVSSRAAEILARLRDGSMPCDGAWPEAKIEVFQRWASTGLRP